MENNNLIKLEILQQENVINDKKKILGIIFVRAFCCIGIVIFHYFCHSNGTFKLLYTTANSSFGFMFVTSFFCISGVVLYYNYPKIKSLKTFYFKRWKSIFPPYYTCYVYFFFRYAFNSHKLFFRGNWTKIFITLIGLDGYLLYKFQTYYLIGEWFIGAIIILYALYPLLLGIITKNNIITNNIIISVLYYFMYKKSYFIISKTRNIITCLTSFYFGIETIRFKKFYLMNKKIFLISFFILIFLSIFKINSLIIIWQIQGFSLFIVLFQIGQYIMLKDINKIFKEISNISFGIYLFNHIIILEVLSLNNPNEWYLHLILLSLIITLTSICSKIHLMVVNSIINCHIFKKLESLFLYNEETI